MTRRCVNYQDFFYSGSELILSFAFMFLGDFNLVDNVIDRKNTLKGESRVISSDQNIIDSLECFLNLPFSTQKHPSDHRTALKYTLSDFTQLIYCYTEQLLCDSSF